MTATAAPTRRPTIGALLSSERIGLTSLRSLRLVALAAVVGGVIGGLAFSDGGTAGVTAVLGGGAAIGAAVLALLGALASSGDYANGVVRARMTAEPRRVRVVLAKTAVVAMVSAAAGVLTSLVLLAVLQPAADPDRLGAPVVDVAAVVLLLAVSSAVTGALGILGGFAIRSVPAAVTAAIGLVFLVPGIFWGIRVGGVYLSDYAVTEAGLGLAYDRAVGSEFLGDVVTLAVWIVAVGATAVALVTRRDV